MRAPAAESVPAALPALRARERRRRERGWSLLLATMVAGCAALAGGPAGATPDSVADRLRSRLETLAGEPVPLTVAGRPLRASTLVVRFYRGRDHRPAWVTADGALDRVAELAGEIRRADRHGLDPNAYSPDLLELLMKRAAGLLAAGSPPSDLLTDLELVASDAFFLLGSHLLRGQVDPATVEPQWAASASEPDAARTLEAAAASGRVRAALDGLLPTSAGYRELERELARYRELAEIGGWPAVPPGPALTTGVADERVRLLRRRLAASGDLVGDTASPLFDDALELAVRAFQARHGLAVDGIVGPATRSALAVTANDRVRQIELNLERWRWLPRDLGRRHLVVNVPAFELQAVEDDLTVMRMRAMVGKPYRQTPSFSAVMTHLVVSPYWYVPPGMAVSDILPAVRIHPPYLAEEGIRVFQGWGAEEREIDPGEVDWHAVSEDEFPYRFRQEPGDHNPLGRIKFMFPNPYNVYLHDTPMQGLFDERRRDFSSGCVRLERPFHLAEWLLDDDPRWTRAELVAASLLETETTIELPEPVAVHIVYWTSWTENGGVVFRGDIYGRDGPLAAALSARKVR